MQLVKATALVVTLGTLSIARADVAVAEPTAETLDPQVQIDGGLSVIGPAYEHPITSHIAIGVEGFLFGTYFLPWFDAGQNVKGFGGGIRPTWFRNANGRGLYIAPYLRIVAVDDESLFGATDVGFTTGAFVGWAFRIAKKLDLRLGGGLQYIRFESDVADARITTSTAFVALDAVIGYRL